MNARATISPLAIVLGVVGALLGALVGSAVLPAVIGALVGWAAGTAATVAWRRMGAPPINRRVDPFAVSEPWRRPVQDAIQARNRFTAALAPARAGPVRDRLVEFAARIDRGVEETWRIAREGQSITEARRRIDRRAAAAELDRLRADGERLASDRSAADTAAALESQLASAERLDRTLNDTKARLQLLNARLDEAVARASELVVVADKGADLAGLGAQIDDVVHDMEALRLALEEVDEIGRPPELPGSSEPAPG
ncbi:MAG: hypothetical protein ACRD0A_06565 [Acidimicrobiales bacterium]